MKRYSVLMLLLLGVTVIAAGSVELLKEAGALAFRLDAFGPLLIVTLGLWIITCAVECRIAYSEESRKS